MAERLAMGLPAVEPEPDLELETAEAVSEPLRPPETAQERLERRRLQSKLIMRRLRQRRAIEAEIKAAAEDIRHSFRYGS